MNVITHPNLSFHLVSKVALFLLLLSAGPVMAGNEKIYSRSPFQANGKVESWPGGALGIDEEKGVLDGMAYHISYYSAFAEFSVVDTNKSNISVFCDLDEIEDERSCHIGIDDKNNWPAGFKVILKISKNGNIKTDMVYIGGIFSPISGIALRVDKNKAFYGDVFFKETADEIFNQAYEGQYVIIRFKKDSKVITSTLSLRGIQQAVAFARWAAPKLYEAP